jgi:hypothetical protein
MTPTQKRVFNLLASAQEPIKVEFAIGKSLINGLKSQGGNMVRSRAEMIKYATDLKIMKENASEAVRTYNALTKNGVELFNDADALLKKIATLAKELGVSVNDVPEFNDVKDALNKFLDAQQDMDSSFEMLKKEL